MCTRFVSLLAVLREVASISVFMDNQGISIRRQLRSRQSATTNRPLRGHPGATLCAPL